MKLSYLFINEEIPAIFIIIGFEVIKLIKLLLQHPGFNINYTFHKDIIYNIEFYDIFIIIFKCNFQIYYIFMKSNIFYVNPLIVAIATQNIDIIKLLLQQPNIDINHIFEI